MAKRGLLVGGRALSNSPAVGLRDSLGPTSPTSFRKF